MILYELVNPSDAYTFLAPSVLIAAAAVTVVGEGSYGAKPVEDDGSESVPVFLLGGLEEWFKEHGIEDVGDYINAHRPAVAACLDSFLIGSYEDRKRMERVVSVISDPAEKAKAHDAWHDERRTSMNDIGARAKHFAEVLRRPPPAKKAAR